MRSNELLKLCEPFEVFFLARHLYAFSPDFFLAGLAVGASKNYLSPSSVEKVREVISKRPLGCRSFVTYGVGNKELMRPKLYDLAPNSTAVEGLLHTIAGAERTEVVDIYNMATPYWAGVCYGYSVVGREPFLNRAWGLPVLTFAVAALLSPGLGRNAAPGPYVLSQVRRCIEREHAPLFSIYTPDGQRAVRTAILEFLASEPGECMTRLVLDSDLLATLSDNEAEASHAVDYLLGSSVGRAAGSQGVIPERRLITLRRLIF